MKISIIADCHLNKSLYKSVLDKEDSSLSFRTADFMKAFSHVIKQNIDIIKPDLIVINGDVFDTFDPANNVRAFFYECLKNIMIAKIPIVILVGNHDICRKHHSLKPLMSLDLKSVKVVDTPQIVKFKNYQLMLFPYSLEVEQGKITLRQQLRDFIESSKEKITSEHTLFFGHFPVKGAKMSSYEVPNATDGNLRKIYYNNNSSDVGLQDLDDIGAQYVFLGDFHEFQVLPTKKCIAMYSGSLEKTDISEKDQQKGFIVYDDSLPEIGKMGHCSFVKYNGCRPIIELKGDGENIQNELEKINNDMQGAIVKLSFAGTSKQLEDFSLQLENIKKKIKDKINPVHMYHDQKIIDEQQEQIAKEIEQEIIKSGNLSGKDVLDAVSDMITEREKDAEEQHTLIQMASDIYQSVMEK